jgi:hypothetical protein
MSVKPLFSNSDIDKWLKAFQEKAEQALILTLKNAGERFVKYARETGRYNDRTGNLRSSIGYIIVKDGTPVSVNFEAKSSPIRPITEQHTQTLADGTKQVRTRTVKVGGDGKEGVAKAERLANQLANEHNTGLVLIGVAGMEYAVWVEAMGLDVITSSSLKTEEYLRESIRITLEKAKRYGRI